MKKVFIILTILIISFGVASIAKAEGASLYLSPQTETSFLGSTFNVSIFVNTGGKDVNTVKVNLKFNPKKLQIANPTTGKSFIAVWISQPTFSNIEGTATFQGGVPSPGINTSSGLVSTITFRAIQPGEAIISILDSSQVLLDDGKGTNILSSEGGGVYKIVIPPPKGPKVFSSTHPDQNKWYNNNSLALSWEKEEGVTDFSYSIDDSFYGVPDNVSEGDHTSVSFTNLKDGILYFHIKAKKGDTWGGITNYILLIDTISPADFSLSFEPTLISPIITTSEPIVFFTTTDSISGLDHYELKLIDLAKTTQRKDTGFFIEVSPPHQLASLVAGEYEVIVRAFDRAMNWQDSSERIEVVPIEKIFYITKGGIIFWTFFFSWRQLILFFSFLIIAILVIVFFWYKRQKSFRQKRAALKEIEEKTKKNDQELKRKLNGI
ncbi:hypothetical protein KJ735_01190 [Patescibacteria group bacterium]|nr:hypothetical protein [Patescibacteria group bacterium]